MSLNKTFSGVVTNLNGGDALSFTAIAAKGLYANATNAPAVPAVLAGSAAFQYLRVNSANNALEWATISVSSPITISSGTIGFDITAIDSTSLVVNSGTLERAALTGAIAASQNSNATLFAGIRDNGSAENDRTNLNFISSTSNTLVVTDDSVNDELEITVQRAALTGDVTASANSNTTAFRTLPARSILANATNASAVPTDLQGSSGLQYLRVNGAATALEWSTISVNSPITNLTGTLGFDSTVALSNNARVAVNKNSGATVGTRRRLNFIEGTGVTLTVADDAANEEVDITIASSSGTAGHIIKDDGTSFTQRAGLNFLSTTTIQVTATDDAANNETEVSFGRGALSGAISASLASAATLFSGIRDNGAAENDRTNLNFLSGDSITSVITDDSGSDELEIRHNYVGNTTEITAASVTGNLGTINIASLTCGGTYRITSASSAFSIEGFTAKTVGFWFVLSTPDESADECTLFHEDATATAANRLALPQAEDLVGVPLNGILFYANDSRWHWIGSNPNKLGRGANKIEVTDGGTNAITIESTSVGGVHINTTTARITASSMIDTEGVVQLDTVPRSDGGVLSGAIDGWGSVFVAYRDVTSSGSASAGDTQFWNGGAPFTFMVVASGMLLTTGNATAPSSTQNVFRNASGGTGGAVSSQFSTAVASQGVVQYGTTFTGNNVISAGGTLAFRWANRTSVGRIWIVGVRLS